MIENSHLRRPIARGRAAVLCLVTLALSGCGLVNTESPFWATVAAIRGGSDTSPPVDRAHVDNLPYASMLAWFDDTKPSFIVLGQVQNGRLFWYSAGQQVIVTRGPYVIQTAGLGRDLTAVQFTKGSVESPLNLIGQERQRSLDARGEGRFAWELRCTYSSAGRENVVILERPMELSKVRETCQQTEGKPIENTYWGDPQTGLIWKSQQVLLPGMAPLNIEILKPFG
ncbi:YjbF family lipoprotein [Indioceanicola profundi]|uniref:YjbF family lipoprotein n=1 Tax=Indioceanicola profundi TaxID=2220096 RepID=UPI000E6AB051|nr:YjbF family lipoprotein [Indioceanicola profundi]